MKKALIILVAALLVFCFAACGNKGDDVDPDSGEWEAETGISDDDVASSDGSQSGAISWWEGEWYGYWKVIGSTGEYADWEGGVWDCYAVIEVNDDATAMMYVWDDEIDMASAELFIEELGGVGPMGSATSEGGEAFRIPLIHADWVIMPTTAEYEDYWGDFWYDDYMQIEATTNTDNGYIDYKIVLRPWGILWDDMPDDDRPPFYDSWYLHNDFYKKDSLLDALNETIFDGGSAHLHSALGGGSSGGGSDKGGSGSGPAEEDSSGDDSGGGSGAGSGGGGAGSGGAVVLSLTNEELKAKWNDFQDSFDKWSDITYDKVVALLGSEGMIDREGDTAVWYRWYASDDGSLDVQFDKSTGAFLRSAINKYGRPD